MPFGIDPLHRRFHRLPAAIVEHDRQNRDLVLLRDRIDTVGRGEMKAAVADHLHDAAIRLRELQPQRHAAGESEPAAGQPDIAFRLGARDVLLQDRPVADRFVEDDVVLRQLSAQRREHEGRVQRARNALVGACRGAPLGRQPRGRRSSLRSARRRACDRRRRRALRPLRAPAAARWRNRPGSACRSAKPHIGKSAFSGSISIWIHFDRVRRAWRIAARTARRNRAAGRDRRAPATAADRSRQSTANPAGC